MRTGELTIDRERYLVTVEGVRVRLTSKEFSALIRLAEAGGRVVSYDTLALTLWERADPAARRRLAVTISRLRVKLGTAAQYVDTVRPIGYRLTLTQ